MAMPWTRAKAQAAEIRADTTGAMLRDLNALFDACFRIQREASEAKGQYIPMVVENVKGAQPWVGSAKWHFGSYYLWGDVPALMPMTLKLKNTGGSWFGQRDGMTLERNDPRDMRRNEDGEYVQANARGGHNHPGKALDGSKNAGNGSWFAIGSPGQRQTGGNPVKHGGDCFNDPSWPGNQGDSIKQPGLSGEVYFDRGAAALSSRSNARKAASAAIAEIPFELSSHIARVFRP